MSRCAVLLVNWNGWADTIECLESLCRLESLPSQIVVCDNASADNSLHYIKAWADGLLSPRSVPTGSRLPQMAGPVAWVEYDRATAEAGGHDEDDAWLVLVRVGENRGFAGGNNVGLRYLLARGDSDYVWLLNNDTVVAPEALSALLRRMVAKPEAGMCGSTLLHYAVPRRVQACGGGYYCRWIGLPWHIGQFCPADRLPSVAHVERWMNYVVGASLLVSREFLVDVGLMTEDYFLYFEETDWAVRATGRYSLAYASDSLVYHKIGRSIGTSSDPRRKSPLCDFYAIRNRLLFTRRHYPLSLPTVYLSVVAAFLVRLLLGEWQRAGIVWRLLTGRQTTWMVDP